MTFGFAQPPDVSLATSADSAARLSRMLEPSEWASAGIPLLRNPREVVTGLHDRHLPGLWTAVVAVLGPEERIIASASFVQHASAPDGWEFRNALLAQLRRVVPHDLRLRVPVRTAVLLYCREGEPRWTETDGAWMWGLRDACTLHGLRCGAYITLTHRGWQVLGEGRGGRRPRSVARTGRLDGKEHLPRRYAPAQPGPDERREASGPVGQAESGPVGQAEPGRIRQAEPAPLRRDASGPVRGDASGLVRGDGPGPAQGDVCGQAENTGQPEASELVSRSRRPVPSPPPGSPERCAPVERSPAVERTRTAAPQPYPAQSCPSSEQPCGDGRPAAHRGAGGAAEFRRRTAAR
ncbi:hypothetical protein CP973_30505 [Streptomyces albofaciens JCM 4342]|nr:hypothetical protein CP973_30505 [Streptomyces albofaciens JCM 4342]